MRHPLRLIATTAASALLGLASLPAWAQPTEGCVSVEVQNVRPQQGFLMVSAFADEASFGRKPMSALRLAAGESTMRFQICNVAGPEVALMLYQDLDSDGKMGSNVLGLPTEPWGASGNPGLMGPKWDTARMPLDGQVLRVRMSQ